MTVTMDFHGAAGSVTGSCYRVVHPKGSFLVDCGMFQGSKTLNALNHRPLPFDPRELTFVLLTHAHIDHSGMLPRLTKAGFRGPIYATPSTSDLLTFMLPDSGSIQESEVERLNRRNQQRGQEKLQPIYTLEDAKACLEQMRDVVYEQWLKASPGVRVRFWNAGHILGSASLEIEIETGDNQHPTLRLLFSGDLGPSHKAFHPEPGAPEGFDYVVTEFDLWRPRPAGSHARTAPRASPRRSEGGAGPRRQPADPILRGRAKSGTDARPGTSVPAQRIAVEPCLYRLAASRAGDQSLHRACERSRGYGGRLALRDAEFPFRRNASIKARP